MSRLESAVLFLLAGASLISSASPTPGHTSSQHSLPSECVRTPRQGFDSVVGSLQCGATVIQYDMGDMAGDYCDRSDAVTISSGTGSATFKLCSPVFTATERLVASLPESKTNLYVETPKARDVVMLLRVARTGGAGIGAR
jgi:hypothetical protein